MFINLKSTNTAKICGDKGYITTQTFKLNNKKEVKIIAPKRENQKSKNTAEDEELLKERSKIERCFAPLKKYNRVCIRRDQNIANYMNFVYFALLDMFYKKILIMIIHQNNILYDIITSHIENRTIVFMITFDKF